MGFLQAQTRMLKTQKGIQLFKYAYRWQQVIWVILPRAEATASNFLCGVASTQFLVQRNKPGKLPTVVYVIRPGLSCDGHALIHGCVAKTVGAMLSLSLSLSLFFYGVCRTLRPAGARPRPQRTVHFLSLRHWLQNLAGS